SVSGATTGGAAQDRYPRYCPRVVERLLNDDAGSSVQAQWPNAAGRPGSGCRSVEQRYSMWRLCLDPQCQPPLPESRFQLLAGAGFMLAAEGLALLAQQNAVAATQRDQRAVQVQALGCTFRTYAALLQLQLDSTWQALLQLVKALLQQAQQPLRMLVLEASAQMGQPLQALFEPMLPGAPQTHVQLIQALRLLRQALAGMAQATAQGVQSQPLSLQADLHALLQLAMTALQLLQHGPGVGAEQFGGRRGGGGA